MDLFGTDEHYVLPVQDLIEADYLIKAFTWLQEEEESIRTCLMKQMPMYIESAKQAADVVEALVQ